MNRVLSRIVSGNLEGTAYIAPQVLVDVDHSEFMDLQLLLIMSC
jgi:hypothetical protein